MLFIRSFVGRRSIYIYRERMWPIDANVMRHGYVCASPSSELPHHTYACERPSKMNTFPAACCVYDSPCPRHGLLLTPTSNIQHFSQSSKFRPKDGKKTTTTSTTHQRKNAARTRTNAELKSYYNTYLCVSPRYDGDAQASRQCPEGSVWLCACRVPHGNECRMCNIIIIILACACVSV